MTRATWILYVVRILVACWEGSCILALCVDVCVNVFVCDLIEAWFSGDLQTKSNV